MTYLVTVNARTRSIEGRFSSAELAIKFAQFLVERALTKNDATPCIQVEVEGSDRIIAQYWPKEK